MRVIYKFPILTVDAQVISVPRGAKWLTVQEQRGAGVIWAEVDTDQPYENRTILIYGTGNPIDVQRGQRVYLGTYQLHGFIWHVYEGLGPFAQGEAQAQEA